MMETGDDRKRHVHAHFFRKNITRQEIVERAIFVIISHQPEFGLVFRFANNWTKQTYSDAVISIVRGDEAQNVRMSKRLSVVKLDLAFPRVFFFRVEFLHRDELRLVLSFVHGPVSALRQPDFSSVRFVVRLAKNLTFQAALFPGRWFVGHKQAHLALIQTCLPRGFHCGEWWYLSDRSKTSFRE